MNDAPDHEQRAKTLVRILFDNADYVQIRDLAQTPLFLWMLVERYRVSNSLPDNRSLLFEVFSRWYLEERYHQAHQEPVQRQCSYVEEARLLGCLGYKLVRERETELPEADVERLVPKELYARWCDLLNEIVASEMLLRERGKLRFLHQSFQEYFAARHFLDHEAKDERTIRARVLEYGWHDTLALLIGFGGDKPSIIRQVIEEALRVNPVLTARCLRMAETPDSALVNQFVDSQLQALLDPGTGEFLESRAAEALAEHGRGRARAALWTVATGSSAPEFSRVVCLDRLAAMPGQARFDLISRKLKEELVEGLTQIFDEPAPIRIREAAISAVVRTELKELSPYLGELVQAGEWPLRRSAWKACGELGLRLTPRQHTAFLTAARERLAAAEEELLNETVIKKYDDLNQERLEILRQIAMAENLPLLLSRRFAFRIHAGVEKIIDQIRATKVVPPKGVEEAWAVLTEEPVNLSEAVSRWMVLLGTATEPTAMAAGHRLCKMGNKLSGDEIQQLFDPRLPPRRLSAVALVASASKQKRLIEPLVRLIRDLIETVDGPDDMEVFSNLVTTLRDLDSDRGRRLAAEADMRFLSDRYGMNRAALSSHYWKLAHDVQPSDSDYSVLIDSQRQSEVRTSVYYLNTFSAGYLWDAQRQSTVRLTDKAMGRFHDLAEAEKDPHWQYRFAIAASRVRAGMLAPWLLKLAESPGMKLTHDIYHSQFGLFEERYVGGVLRAIGCMARQVLDSEQKAEALPLVEYLRQRYDLLTPSEERSVVVGLTTALGYLGDWEPILKHLSSAEPWMHQAAVNVLEEWVPGPLASEPNEERERAIRWIIQQLRRSLILCSQVRSTLAKIKNGLEVKLGRHIVVDN